MLYILNYKKLIIKKYEIKIKMLTPTRYRVTKD